MDKRVNNLQAYKRMKTLFKSFSWLLIIIFISCGDRESSQKTEPIWWKYGSGYHIGDVLYLNDSKIKVDTIFRDKNPVAIITHCGKPLFYHSSILKIESIEKGESGTYHFKGSN